VRHGEHQSYRLNGKTPAEALREALGTDELPPFTQEEDTEPAAA